MNYKKMLTGIFAGLLLYVPMNMVQAAVPKDAPKDVKYILGFYYGNGENIIIRENNDKLELLYRFSREDKTFSGANIYPLTKVHFDAYTMNESGPMSSSEANVRFERDSDGYGIACRIGGHTYTRYFLGSGEGERAEKFKLPVLANEKWESLRTEAKKAVMPASLAEGENASLVDAATILGLKVESVYGNSANCFSKALYPTTKLYVAQQVAYGLEKVQEQLAQKGYGLILYDAYRPWHISKLANLALPEDKKHLLEDPDTLGSVHNTGLAVDVSLYDLQTGKSVEMISGFDEPSMRQYASYPGGTTKQRYLRQMLREIMEDNGFQSIEMEWWHFIYITENKMAHLNVEVK